LKINHLRAAEGLVQDPDREVAPGEDPAPRLDPGLDLVRQNVVVEETAAEVHRNVAEVSDPLKEEIHPLKRSLLKRDLPFAVDEDRILPLVIETHQMPREAFPAPLKRMAPRKMEGVVCPPRLKRRRKGRKREERHPAHALLRTKEVPPAPPLLRKSEEVLLRNAARKNPQLLRGRTEGLVMQDPCREVLQEVQDQEVVAETRHLHDEEEKDVLEGAIPRPPLRCIN